MNRWGLLRGGQSGTFTWKSSFSGHKDTISYIANMGERPNIRVIYTTTKKRTGEKFDFDYQIRLTSTQCNYGGKRFWFICPHCSRRAGIVYLAGRYDRFVCRDCSDLTYDSRNESRLGRFGQLGYMLKAERQYEELYSTIKRWTWRGRPTRKAIKLKALEAKMANYEGGPSIDDLLLGKF